MTIAEIYESELVDIEKVPIAFKHLLDAVLCVISQKNAIEGQCNRPVCCHVILDHCTL